MVLYRWKLQYYVAEYQKPHYYLEFQDIHHPWLVMTDIQFDILLFYLCVGNTSGIVSYNHHLKDYVVGYCLCWNHHEGYQDELFFPWKDHHF